MEMNTNEDRNAPAPRQGSDEERRTRAPGSKQADLHQEDQAVPAPPASADSSPASASGRPTFLQRFQVAVPGAIAATLQEAPKFTPLPDDYQPAELDIVSGRGKGRYNWKGNVRFRNIVDSYVDRYLNLPNRASKSELLYEIMDQVMKTNQPCRFVKQVKHSDGTSSWSETCGVAAPARNKVLHAMQEAILARKKNKKTSSKRKLSADHHHSDDSDDSSTSSSKSQKRRSENTPRVSVASAVAQASTDQRSTRAAAQQRAGPVSMPSSFSPSRGESGLQHDVASPVTSRKITEQHEEPDPLPPLQEAVTSSQLFQTLFPERERAVPPIASTATAAATSESALGQKAAEPPVASLRALSLMMEDPFQLSMPNRPNQSAYRQASEPPVASLEALTMLENPFDSGRPPLPPASRASGEHRQTTAEPPVASLRALSMMEESFLLGEDDGAAAAAMERPRQRSRSTPGPRDFDDPTAPAPAPPTDPSLRRRSTGDFSAFAYSPIPLSNQSIAMSSSFLMQQSDHLMQMLLGGDVDDDDSSAAAGSESAGNEETDDS